MESTNGPCESDSLNNSFALASAKFSKNRDIISKSGDGRILDMGITV